MSYEDYIQIMVDTTNIILQTQNDLDIKFEIVVSGVKYLQLIKPISREPYDYEPELRSAISDYDKYDSIVLLNYQPWEGTYGAQGYAMVKGICHPANKIMYILPYQNSAFYLAHELGHQLGLNHQVKTSCYTSSYMSVMTIFHTNSYERARWTKCENDLINNHICELNCLFNKPDNYQIVKNKYSTMPGSRMSNDQQAKMIEPTDKAIGEVLSCKYRPTELASRCLYFQYLNEATGQNPYAYSPMLPGSSCGDDSICYMDKCVPKSQLDSSILTPEYVTNIRNLNQYCSAAGSPSELKASNNDRREDVQCVDWEDDFLCQPSNPCPGEKDESFPGLYTRHSCCAKCSKKTAAQLAVFNRAQQNSKNMIQIFLFIVPFFIS